MALNLFKILTIFGNLQRAVNHSLRWLKKACSAQLNDTIKTAFINKRKDQRSPLGPNQDNCRDICSDDNHNINAVGRLWDNVLHLNAETSRVRLEHQQSHPQNFHGDTFTMIPFPFLRRHPVKWHHRKFIYVSSGLRGARGPTGRRPREDKSW